MFSGPVAARPSCSGRGGAALHAMLDFCRLPLRRLRRALLCALSLYLSFVIVSSAGDREKDAVPLVNLFLDITSNRLADEVDLSRKHRLDLAGMPVVVGGKRQNGAAPSIAAGIAGSYRHEFDRTLSLQPSGFLSRTHTDGSGLLSRGQIGGDVAFEYREGGSRLLLRPSVHATLLEDTLDRMDYALESRLWQAIGRGIELTATLGHSWRVSELAESEDRETEYGRLGMDLALFDQGRLELAYGFSATDGRLASQFRFSQGPTLLAHLALAPGWRLDGGYSFLAAERGYDDHDPQARRREWRHRLDLKSDWDLSSTTGAAWHVSAGYEYDQTIADAGVTVPASHAALVNFALNF